jgi:hypothetical protein
VGPLIGALLILATDAPFWLVNILAGIIYTLAMPFVALTTAYVYFDTRTRHELVDDRSPADTGTSPSTHGAGRRIRRRRQREAARAMGLTRGPWFSEIIERTSAQVDTALLELEDPVKGRSVVCQARRRAREHCGGTAPGSGIRRTSNR